MGKPNSDEYIAKMIREMRIQHEYSQSDLAAIAGMSRPWVTLIERGGIDPVYFYKAACKIYGVDVANEIYGVDWRLYSGERIGIYFWYYKKKKVVDPVALGVPYGTARNFLLEPEAIRNNYKDEIDTLFPDLEKDKDVLFNYHLIGRNSVCRYENGVPIVFFNVARNQSPDLDDDSTTDTIVKDAQMFADFHSKTKCFDDMKRSAIIPYSELSFSRICMEKKED